MTNENSGYDRIVKIETFRWELDPRILWVEITTAHGLVGLGETYYIPGAVEAVIHEMAAPLLLGQSPFEIERHWATLFGCANFYGYAGAEMRAFSAIDIALWDIVGQSAGKPIYSLLGGKVRDDIMIYNTCVDRARFQDHSRMLHSAGELAADLLESGIRAMKIFPFDHLLPAIAPGHTMGPVGHFLSLEQLKEGLRPVEEIRRAVGDKMEIMIEGHSRWDLNAAIKIGRTLEPYQPFWMEDMMMPDSADDLARLAAECRIPQAVSERLFTKYHYRQVLEKKAAHVLMVDVVWTGGITESKKIAAMADAYHLPIAPHDCTGPVAVFASLHLCASCTNTAVMETVRGFYDGGYYEDAVTQNITVKDGRIAFPSTPGLGTALRPDFKASKQMVKRVTKE
ncbi:mandelate racemase/muconate lactonizing enzyme family protein [Paenibacillus cymbidii]|uniref:mandelate racemase/muconate lactonizing enzyme family protein n=1 Tax=Paenibacillus cymbidii TaxID=1639034 RepID=UPI00108049D6|nr:mandelate racemase/muconate lactonizing enzyme family protein [Paenibacillus cymbidii]